MAFTSQRPVSCGRLVACLWLASALCLSTILSFGQEKEGKTDNWRVWTDSSGTFQTKAQLVKHDATKVNLRKTNGQLVEVPVDRLSLEDRAFLKALTAQAATPSNSVRDEAKPTESIKLSEQTPGQQFLKNKLDELLRIKSKDDFGEWGFSNRGPYNAWLVEVTAKMDSVDFHQLEQLAVGDLQMLALKYVDSKGAETKYTTWARHEIEKTIVRRK